MPDLEDENFQDVVSLHFKRIVDSVNTKEGSIYQPIENASFIQLFNPADTQNNRNVYRKCFDLVMLNGGVIPANTTVSFPHGITSLTNTFLIFASCTATGPSKYFTVVYTNVGGTVTGVWLDSTNVNFTNPTSSNLTQAFVMA